MKRLLLALVLCAGAAGCARVKPYQRERLALPGMQFDPSADPDQHALETREGSAGAYGAIGSGCGCN